MLDLHLDKLIQVPEKNRDENWENHFFKHLCASQLKVLSSDPQVGPDGWPYLMVQISPEGSDPAQNILAWLSDKGIGLVVNPQKSYPDFVFSYGMIWNFRETGYFIQPSIAKIETGPVEIYSSLGLHTGAPTEEYLPKYVRNILKEFFRDQGILDPRILMIGQKEGSHFDLAFSLESLGNPPFSEHNGILEAISWFLPQHYSILLTSEKLDNESNVRLNFQSIDFLGTRQ